MGRKQGDGNSDAASIHGADKFALRPCFHAPPVSALVAIDREPRGLREKVVALREAPCLACRRPVVPDGALAVSGEFQQMCSNSVQAVMIREAGVRLEGVQQFQALRRAVHHRRRDRVIQGDHGVVGHAPGVIR